MRYYEMKEFACKCCGQLPPSAEQNLQALVEHVLDPARERLGMPITVNSGYRCPAHNKAVVLTENLSLGPGPTDRFLPPPITRARPQ